jgi:hypothetical protein
VFPLPDGTPAGKPFTLAVDGRPIATGSARDKAPDLRLALDPAAVARLRNGARVSLAGTPLAASLQGLAAALLAMDERQARAAPPLPVIVQPTLPARPPGRLTKSRARTFLSRDARTAARPRSTSTRRRSGSTPATAWSSSATRAATAPTTCSRPRS